KDVSADYIREVLGLKNRYEIELHKNRTFQVLSDFANGADLGIMASQMLTNYLIVYDWDNHLDVQWQDLIGFFGGYKFVTKPQTIDYSRSKKWIQKSGGGLLKTMAFESYVKNRDLLGEMVMESKVNDKYEVIMRRIAEEHGLNYEEVLKNVERHYQQEW
ncbi:replication initiation factor domain-containing protein, partial [Streptococcus gallolyticus]|uniref:replication initiation factor domain-containing protein n=1 Tax=Streptococcus gallolyticus TaxID=315405 RepID=UPI0018C869A7